MKKAGDYLWKRSKQDFVNLWKKTNEGRKAAEDERKECEEEDRKKRKREHQKSSSDRPRLPVDISDEEEEAGQTTKKARERKAPYHEKGGQRRAR